MHRAIQVNPFAAHREIGFIAAPGITNRTFMDLPAFLEFEGVAHEPTQDHARGNAYSQLSIQFGKVAVAELDAQIPAHASDDHVVSEPALTKERARVSVPRGMMGSGQFILMTADVGC
jgi:hypothetical protein